MLRADEEWLVVGCLYKEQPLKPSILDEYAGERSVAPPRVRQNYACDRDTLVLEDESGRVTLAPGMWNAGRHGGVPGARGSVTFPLQDLVSTLVTGVVAAFRGVVLDTGEFAVNDVAIAGFTTLPGAPPLPLPAPGDQPEYLLLASGLRIGGAQTDPVALQLLHEFVLGLIGTGTETASVARIVRVILAGNTIGSAVRGSTLVNKPLTSASASPATSGSHDKTSIAEAEALAAPLREADVYMSTMCAGVHVDVMPGDEDPANYTMPQQPLHPVMFPASRRFAGSSFRCTTNPYEAQVAGVRVLGSSGQAVQDVARYSQVSSVGTMLAGDELQLVSHAKSRGGAAADGAEPIAHVHHVDPLEALAATGAGKNAEDRASDEGADDAKAPAEIDVLCNTLMWRHMAPTAPDTLSCYPFYETDPFIIGDERLPHVYFSGCGKAFQTRWLLDASTGRGARAIIVPDFATTQTVVLVNLRSGSLETQPIVFAGAQL